MHQPAAAKARSNSNVIISAAAGISIAVVGFAIFAALAAGPAAFIEAEDADGSPTTGASVISDPAASQSQAVLFGQVATDPGGDPGDDPGTDPDPGSDKDGTQAAKLLNWGPVINGDEFDYEGAPGPKWSPYDGPGHAGNGIRSPGAFSVANGIMTIFGDQGGTTGGAAFNDASSITYRDEARVRMYATGGGSGSQYHPVLIRWPDSDEWPEGGEDDYMETDIGDPGVSTFIHHPNQSSGSAQSHAEVEVDITQWHNYAIERSDTHITGYLDGKQWFQFTVEETNGQVPGPMHPTFQMDNFGGDSHFEAKFEIEWYRIYAAP